MQPPRCPYRGNASALRASGGCIIKDVFLFLQSGLYLVSVTSGEIVSNEMYSLSPDFPPDMVSHTGANASKAPAK